MMHSTFWGYYIAWPWSYMKLKPLTFSYTSRFTKLHSWRFARLCIFPCLTWKHTLGIRSSESLIARYEKAIYDMFIALVEWGMFYGGMIFSVKFVLSTCCVLTGIHNICMIKIMRSMFFLLWIMYASIDPMRHWFILDYFFLVMWEKTRIHTIERERERERESERKKTK